MSTSFHNAFALPLLLISAIVRDTPSLSGDPKAFDRAVAFIFLFTVRTPTVAASFLGLG